MKIAAITSNIGGFDTVKKIPDQIITFDRFYYTDANLPAPMHTQDNRMKAKLMKICPHLFLPDYDFYIWIDGNIQVKVNDFIHRIALHSTKKGFAISNHPCRKSIYEEADFIIAGLKKGSKYLSARYSIESIKAEMTNIQKHCGNDLKGLYWCGLFMRPNDPWVNECCERWFMDNVLYSNFDQLSFVKMITWGNLEVNTFNLGEFTDNAYYKLIDHLK
jgi:hypothetical protein